MIYHCWDQDDQLGPSPWRQDDPKVQAWEQAHGHDVRLKCYPEFGCQLVEPDAFQRGVTEAARVMNEYLDGLEFQLPGDWRRKLQRRVEQAHDPDYAEEAS